MRTYTMLLSLISLSLLGSGCDWVGSVVWGARDALRSHPAEQVANDAVDAITGGRIGASIKEGTVTITDKQTGKNYLVGENIILPDSFPKEMLVYPSSTILAVTTGNEAALNLKADASSDAVALWYSQQLGALKWKESSKVAAGGYENRSFIKEKVTLTFTFLGSRDAESKTTVVTIMRKEDK